MKAARALHMSRYGHISTGRYGTTKPIDAQLAILPKLKDLPIKGAGNDECPTYGATTSYTTSPQSEYSLTEQPRHDSSYEPSLA